MYSDTLVVAIVEEVLTGDNNDKNNLENSVVIDLSIIPHSAHKLLEQQVQVDEVL